jgi:hypothetical protein
MELTTHLHTVSNIRICGTIPPVPMFFSDVVLSEHRDGFISCKARHFHRRTSAHNVKKAVGFSLSGTVHVPTDY